MKKVLLALTLLSTALLALAAPIPALVIQTDFGTKDGAVAAMKGVAFGVSPKLSIFDLSHQNTPYDVWEASYRLSQTAPFWPAGTVFVSVIDPGVGTARKSVVLHTKSDQYFVGPDNGTWTLISESLGIDAVREIDETKHRRPGSERSYTFHGRDVYAYVGAQLASGTTRFEDIGPLLPPKVIVLPHELARRDGAALIGSIPYLDFQYGNVWTNIPDELVQPLKLAYGDRVHVTITKDGQPVCSVEATYARTFGDVPEGQPLVYINSLMNVAVALNMGDFAKTYHVSSGSGWSFRLEKVAPSAKGP